MFLAVWQGIAPLASSQAARDSEHRLWYWLYLQNWSPRAAHEVNWLSHTWSLAIEEQFYLVWPLVVYRASPLALGVWSLLLSVLALLFRFWLVNASSLPWEMAYRLTPSRLDALALGAFVASAIRIASWRELLRRVTVHAGLVVSSAVVLLSMLNNGWHIGHPITATVGHSLLALGFALVVFALSDAPGGSGWLHRGLRTRPLRFFGRYSYAIYLFHWPVAALLADPPETFSALTGYVRPETLGHWTLVASLGAATSVLLAPSSWHLVEKRFLAMKDRWRIAD